MHKSFTTGADAAVSVWLYTAEAFKSLENDPFPSARAIAKAQGFTGGAGQLVLVPDADGSLAHVLGGIGDGITGVGGVGTGGVGGAGFGVGTGFGAGVGVCLVYMQLLPCSVGVHSPPGPQSALEEQGTKQIECPSLPTMHFPFSLTHAGRSLGQVSSL